MNAFEILGLHPTADQGEVERAYRTAYDDPAVQAEAHARDRLDAAYMELADPARRAALRDQVARDRRTIGSPTQQWAPSAPTRPTSPMPGQMPPPPAPGTPSNRYVGSAPGPVASSPAGFGPRPQATAPLPGPHPVVPPGQVGPACKFCGRAPAAPLTFRQNTGLLLARQFRTATGLYCRDCALAVGRRYQNHTLVLGWWGIQSFFLNIAFVLGNTSNLRTAHGLADPQPPEGRQVSPGRSVLLRPGGLLFMLGVTVLIAFLAVALLTPSPS